MKKNFAKLQALFAGMLFVLILCVAYGVQSSKNEEHGKNAVGVYTLNDVVRK